VPVAEARHRDAAGAELAVDVDDRRAAGLSTELAVAGEPSEQAVERRVERSRGAGEAVAACERDRDDVGFDLLRRDRLHLDLHSRAMLADRLPRLPPHAGGSQVPRRCR